MNPELEIILKDVIAGVPGAYQRFKQKRIELQGGCSEREFVFFISRQSSLAKTDPEALIDLGIIITQSCWILSDIPDIPAEVNADNQQFPADYFVSLLITASEVNVGAQCALLYLLNELEVISTYCKLPLRGYVEFAILQDRAAQLRNMHDKNDKSLEPFFDFFDGLVRIRNFRNKKDLELAFEILNKSNLPAANIELGICYEKGLMGDKDIITAFMYFKKAMEQQHPHGCFNVGWILFTRCSKESRQKFGYANYSASKICQHIMHAYTMAAIQGHSQAQYHLGTCHEDGKDIKKAWDVVLHYYREAAKQNFFNAFMHLGKLYEKGYGVTRNLSRALEFYITAARHDDDVEAAQGAIIFLKMYEGFAALPSELISRANLALETQLEDSKDDENETDKETETKTEKKDNVQLDNQEDEEDQEKQEEQNWKDEQEDKTLVCMLKAVKFCKEEFDYLDDTIFQCTSIINKYNNCFSAYLYRAWLYLKKNTDASIKEALNDLTLAGQLIKSETDKADFNNICDRAFEIIKDYDNALISYYTVLITVNPGKNYEYYLDRAILYKACAMHIEAIKDFTTYLEYDSENADVYELRAQSYRSRHWNRSAITDERHAAFIRRQKIFGVSKKEKKTKTKSIQQPNKETGITAQRSVTVAEVKSPETPSTVLTQQIQKLTKLTQELFIIETLMENNAEIKAIILKLKPSDEIAKVLLLLAQKTVTINSFSSADISALPPSIIRIVVQILAQYYGEEPVSSKENFIILNSGLIDFILKPIDKIFITDDLKNKILQALPDYCSCVVKYEYDVILKNIDAIYSRVCTIELSIKKSLAEIANGLQKFTTILTKVKETKCAANKSRSSAKNINYICSIVDRLNSLKSKIELELATSMCIRELIKNKPKCTAENGNLAAALCMQKEFLQQLEIKYDSLIRLREEIAAFRHKKQLEVLEKEIRRYRKNEQAAQAAQRKIEQQTVEEYSGLPNSDSEDSETESRTKPKDMEKEKEAKAIEKDVKTVAEDDAPPLLSPIAKSLAVIGVFATPLAQAIAEFPDLLDASHQAIPSQFNANTNPLQSRFNPNAKIFRPATNSATRPGDTPIAMNGVNHHTIGYRHGDNSALFPLPASPKASAVAGSYKTDLIERGVLLAPTDNSFTPREDNGLKMQPYSEVLTHQAETDVVRSVICAVLDDPTLNLPEEGEEDAENNEIFSTSRYTHHT